MLIGALFGHYISENKNKSLYTISFIVGGHWLLGENEKMSDYAEASQSNAKRTYKKLSIFDTIF